MHNNWEIIFTLKQNYNVFLEQFYISFSRQTSRQLIKCHRNSSVKIYFTERKMQLINTKKDILNCYSLHLKINTRIIFFFGNVQRILKPQKSDLLVLEN